LIIVINGSGKVESTGQSLTEQSDALSISNVSQGQVWLQHAGMEVKLSSTNADTDLLVFRSSVARQ